MELRLNVAIKIPTIDRNGKKVTPDDAVRIACNQFAMWLRRGKFFGHVTVARPIDIDIEERRRLLGLPNSFPPADPDQWYMPTPDEQRMGVCDPFADADGFEDLFSYGHDSEQWREGTDPLDEWDDEWWGFKPKE
ncbi:MAG: hypothetical protein ACYSUF_00365 [Planctomycetota bacterium]